MSLTNAAGGSMRRHTWRCKCLNLPRGLNRMFAQEAQTVRLLLTRPGDVKSRAFRDFRREKTPRAYQNVFIPPQTKKIIFDSRAGKFICLANQGYPERQRITHPISAEGGIAPRMTKKSALIGCGVIWMTRSRGDGRGVLIKSHWRYDPNSACPVISPLTKNHYIRCQRGSIFWQGEVPSFPAPSPKPVHRLQTWSNKKDEVKDLFKSAPPSPQLRQGESLFVCWGRLYQRGIIKFLLAAYCA